MLKEGVPGGLRPIPHPEGNLPFCGDFCSWPSHGEGKSDGGCVCYRRICPACNAEDWGAGWGACSGGSQSRTNACGGVDTRACLTVTIRVIENQELTCPGRGTTRPTGYTGGTALLQNLTTGVSFEGALNASTDYVHTFANLRSLPTAQNYLLGFSITDPAWRLTCTNFASVPYSPLSASVAPNFYISRVADPWWQVAGGDVYASLGISEDVPSAAKFPALAHLTGQNTSSGVMISGGSVNVSRASDPSGSISVGPLGPTRRAWSVNNSPYGTATKESYEYFRRLFELGTLAASNDNFGADTMSIFPDTSLKDFPDGNKVYYRDGDLTITGLPVAANEKRTIIVNGDVTVSENVTVTPGGFLLVVSSGTITFGENVTNAQGVYVAEGVLAVHDANVGSGLVRQFVGEGVFVGWSGVTLARTLNSLGSSDDDFANNTDPAERFVYRPDLILNAPESLKRPSIQWEEVAPSGKGNAENTNPTPIPSPTPACAGTKICAGNTQPVCKGTGWVCCSVTPPYDCSFNYHR